MTQLLLLFGVAVLVALNGLFVAAEFALVRASQGRVEQLRDDGRRGAALVLKQIDRIDEYLSACQLGITMTSLGIGFLGEPAIASLFEDLFGTAISHNASLAISLGLAYLITTALHITFGEQVPKIYSIVHSETNGMRVARPLRAVPHDLQPADLAAEHGVELDPAAGGGGRARRVRGGQLLRGPEADHRPQPAWRTSSIPARRGCSRASSTCTSSRRAR